MKHLAICLLGICFFTSAFTEETAEPCQNTKKDVAKLSEAFGHLIGKNITSMGLKFDMLYVIKGLQDAAAGKTSPMTEMECIQALTSAQESAFKEQSSTNLALAEEFLKKNINTEGMVSLEEGKVLYKVEKSGTGEKLQENSSPLIRYVGKFLDGSVFGSSSEDEPISLEEMIPGLKDGLIGMQEGEKRTIYIHPDLAYGTTGSLPPNSLLTFEIEIVKAQAPVQLENLSSNDASTSSEIALPESLEQLR
ncbi:MAG: FKBP-type peptidyl-prolyl cis-trans isomerase [Verrucomicrobia bacterium]|nr:FKBP-type peptidyl-prolyl cis-trans isomerase [Verrucomicrobiota bacterium]